MVWPVKTAGLIEGGLESKKRFRPGDVFSLDFLFYRTGCCFWNARAELTSESPTWLPITNANRLTSPICCSTFNH